MGGGPTVAIVGGGCSATLGAIHLLSRPVDRGSPQRIVMVERGIDIGRGVAYATTCDRHLLNVPAGDMSAYPDDPAHFARWLGHHRPGSDARSFVPRRWYGDYLRASLVEARRGAGGHRSFERVRGDVVDITRCSDRLTLTCAGGRALEADSVVLAPGNFPPRRPHVVPVSAVATGRYIDNPWGVDSLSGIPVDAAVLILGSGLTAVDTVLSLDDQGHRGPIRLLSRHGLLPEAHLARGLRLMSPRAPRSGLPAGDPSADVSAEVSAGVRRAPAKPPRPRRAAGTGGRPLTGCGRPAPRSGHSCPSSSSAGCSAIFVRTGTSTATAWRPRWRPLSTPFVPGAGSA